MFMEMSELFPSSSHGSPLLMSLHVTFLTTPIVHIMPQLNFLGSIHHSEMYFFLCTYIPCLCAYQL